MDFQIPEPFAVTLWKRPKAGKNAAGQTVYGEPVATPRKVRGFQPAEETEVQSAQLAGRKITVLVMLTKDGDWPSDAKVELWDGRTFEVNGDVQDYNLGPFDFEPGYAVNLRKVTDGAT